MCIPRHTHQPRQKQKPFRLHCRFCEEKTPHRCLSTQKFIRVFRPGGWNRCRIFRHSGCILMAERYCLYKCSTYACTVCGTRKVLTGPPKSISRKAAEKSGYKFVRGGSFWSRFRH